MQDVIEHYGTAHSSTEVQIRETEKLLRKTIEQSSSIKAVGALG